MILISNCYVVLNELKVSDTNSVIDVESVEGSEYLDVPCIDVD